MENNSPKKDTDSFIVAGCKSWNKDIFKRKMAKHGGEWYYISKPGELTKDKIRKINPRYIFFLHWSWIVPPEIYKNFECVVFHMTDLPFGRGGSPLQNLIVRGIYNTKISAIRMVGEVDAGPVYLKRPFSVRHGSAQELYKNASEIASGIIDYIIHHNPKARPQGGKTVVFKRRKPKESLVPARLTSKKLYDFIRMLDAEGYPRAFIDYDGYRLEFRNAYLNKNSVEADVSIKKYGKK